MSQRTIDFPVGVGASLDDLAWGSHDQRAYLPYSINFGPALDDLAVQMEVPPGSVTLSAVQPQRSSDPALVVSAGSVDASSRLASVWIGGGTPGGTAKIGLFVLTSTDATFEAVAALQIVDRSSGLIAIGPVVTSALLPAPMAAPDFVFVPGVVADGAAGTDNRMAIQAALDSGRHVLLPPGDIRISGTLHLTHAGQLLYGYGPATRLRPDFATGDVIQVGASGAGLIHVQLRDFVVWPSVTRTSGAAVHVIEGGHFRMSGVWLGTYEDAVSDGMRLFEGLALQNTGEVVISGGGMLGCSDNGILVYDTTVGGSAEVRIEPSVQIALNGCGVQVGGGMGGVYIAGNIQQNGIGIVVSKGVFSPQWNREIFFDEAIVDSNVHGGAVIEAYSIAASLVINNGWIGGVVHPDFPGLWVAVGNAVTIINGLRCDSNAGQAGLFEGGPVIASNYRADQNGRAGLTIGATCGAVYVVNPVITNCATEHAMEFPAGYTYQVSVLGGSILPNAVPGIGNAPSGANQTIQGVIGFSGSGSTSGAAAQFVFTQTLPASVWTIVHNLGRRPTPAIVTTSGDQVEGDVHYVDGNSLTLTFASAFAGIAYL